MKNNQKEDPKIPLKQAYFWILLSVLLFVGSATLGLLYYLHIKELYGNDNAYRVVALVQTTPNQEALKTVFLAELLDLSVDHPTNLYRLNCKDAQRKLLSCPIIKEAKVRKVKPGTVYIDYTMRKPVAYLSDFSNTAVDSEGFPFPFKPFYTPKRLPQIYLGIANHTEENNSSEGNWGVALESKEAIMGLELLKEIDRYYSKEITHLKKIDVSKAYASSCGQRQVLVLLEEQIEQGINGKAVVVIYPRLLRLNCEFYRQGLANYMVLRNELNNQQLKVVNTSHSKFLQPLIIIDLRLPQLGFISKQGICSPV